MQYNKLLCLGLDYIIQKQCADFNLSNEKQGNFLKFDRQINQKLEKLESEQVLDTTIVPLNSI